jgi:hypothetical protein
MWTSYILWPWQRVRLIDGTFSLRGDRVMRRRVNAKWQYRALTAAEEADAFAERW